MLFRNQVSGRSPSPAERLYLHQLVSLGVTDQFCERMAFAVMRSRVLNPLGEALVDWSNQLSCFSQLSLRSPKLSKADRGTKLKRLRALSVCRCEALSKVLFCGVLFGIWTR